MFLVFAAELGEVGTLSAAQELPCAEEHRRPDDKLQAVAADEEDQILGVILQIVPGGAEGAEEALGEAVLRTGSEGGGLVDVQGDGGFFPFAVFYQRCLEGSIIALLSPNRHCCGVEKR